VGKGPLVLQKNFPPISFPAYGPGGDSMGATENAGFIAKVQRNLGLDFVKKQH